MAESVIWSQEALDDIDNIYEIKEPEIHIMAVIHGKRLLDAIEDRFDPDT